jgi:probable phosphoglycerate mutase
VITTELVLARHGQAQCNADGAVGGPNTCTGLTSLGRAQVKAAAIRLATEHLAAPFAALYAGPRIRLRETAEILGATLDMEAIVEAGLDGPVHGEADGKPWHEVKNAAHGGPHAYPDRPWAKGSDTWNGYLERSGAFLRDLIARHDGDRVLLAAHGETILALHTVLLELRPGLQSGFTVDHGSLTRWQHHHNRLGQRRWLLDRHNDTAHLLPLAEKPRR